MNKVTRRFIVVVAAALTAVALVPFEVNAAPPPEGYKSWVIKSSTFNQELNVSIPIRHGYYDDDYTDPDTGQKRQVGFGTDKIYFKHDVDNMPMVRHILESRDVSFGGVDGKYTGQAVLKKTLTVTFCYPFGGTVVCQPGNPHKMVAVVELDEMDFYYDGRASMKPNPDDPPTQHPTESYLMEGGSYVPDEEIVGLVTLYEDGEDGHIHPELKEWDYMKEVFPYLA